MNRISKYCSTAFLLSALALPLMAQARPGGTGRHDRQIERQVTQQLERRDVFKGVRATTEDGIVTLQGQVPYYSDKLNAQKTVKKVENVQGVRNLIAVSTTVPDPELATKLAKRLRYDIDQHIVFNNLNLAVRNGVVTIGGQVYDYSDRASALAIVQDTPGVQDVIDKIQVLPLSPYDDELRVRLVRAIYGAPALQRYGMDPQAPIRIIVNNGHVTLAGVVDSSMDRVIAEMRARSVPGVFSVTDNLAIAGQQAQGM
jgi:osmotically-inducible protein OsmY